MSNVLEAGPEVHATIAQLFVYPVKSCAGVAVAQALLTETGLDLDRAWMVVDAQGDFVSQREAPRLALVQPQIKGTELILRAPGMLALHLLLDGVEQPCQVQVWDDTVAAFDMGDLAAQWFTDFLSLTQQGLPLAQATPYRLARFDPEQRRLSNLSWTGGVQAPNQFSDGYPVLVLGQASLDGLNAKLARGGHASVGVQRFRPNIVLAGLDAHDEDRLDTLHIRTESGTVQLQPVKPCPRCPIPNIDPATALSSPQVGDTLQGYRRDPRLQSAVTFGMNAIILDGVDQVLKLGQAVSANYRWA